MQSHDAPPSLPPASLSPTAQKHALARCIGRASPTRQHTFLAATTMSASNAAAHQSSSQQVDPAIEKLLRETKSLKAKIDLLEAENKALKKSLYELSYIYSAHIGQSQHQQQEHQQEQQTRSLSSAGTADDDLANIANGSSGGRGGGGAVPFANEISQGYGASSNRMAVAVGQLLSAMSASQQSQKSDPAPSTNVNGSDPGSRAVEAQLKTAADLIKVEEEGVRRLNMGNIGELMHSLSTGMSSYVPTDN